MRANAVLVDLGPIYSHNPKRNGLNDSLGLGYISAYCRSLGHEVEILNRGNSRFTLEEMAEYILSRNFKVVGISLTQERVDLGSYFLKLLRSRECNAHITLGGYLPTLAPENTLDAFPQVDSLVLNEGELTFSELLEAIENGSSLKIPGLMTREILKEGTFQLRPPIQNLDALPFPDRPGQVGPSGVTWLYSSRGCNYNCTFCSIHVFYKACSWRPRSAENVVDEIEYLVKEKGVREIQFCDDNFLCGHRGIERAKEIAKEILKRHIKISFCIECRLDSIELDLFKLLKKVGLKSVLIGIESIDDSSLKLFRKSRSKGLLEQGLKILDSLSIEVHYGFIMFHPKSTLQTLQKNIRFIKSRFRRGKISPWEAFLCYTSILQPNSGTSLVSQLKKEALITEPSPLKLEMCFRDPAVVKLWKVRNHLRYTLEGFVNHIRSEFHTDCYTPEVVKEGERLVDESHQLGMEIMDYFMDMLDSSKKIRRDGQRIQEKFLLRIDQINNSAESYFKKFEMANEYRFQTFKKNGNDYLYHPDTCKQIPISKGSLKLLYFWQYPYFKDNPLKEYIDDGAKRTCERLMKKGTLVTSRRDHMLGNPEISPFVLWDCLEVAS
jgi:radical SAM superfamily enzyme YgiQ (UPF0313 family)